jgi:hypothetical protein
MDNLNEKEKRDRCLRIADRKFDKPSAYKSGAVVRCRKGNIWKDLKEAFTQLLQEDESLHKWFKRSQDLKVKKEDGLIVTHLTEKVDIKPVVEKKVKNVLNILLVDLHLQGVKEKVKVKLGVKLKKI